MRSTEGRVRGGSVRAGSLMCVLAASLSACVTSMYPGARRPESEIVVVAERTQIDTIDDTKPPDGTKFALLAGRHRLDLRLDDTKMGRYQANVFTLPLCFTGLAGHAYLVQPVYEDRLWRPQITDYNAAYPVASNDCSPQIPPPAAPTTVASEAPPDGSAPPSSVPAVTKPRMSTWIEAPPARRQSYKPTLDLGLEVGLVQGGQELVTATNSDGGTATLGAGDGLLLAFAFRFTPLWVSDAVGFGFGVGAGVKYWSVGGNGAEASMAKYPLIGSGHALLSVDPTWLLFLEGGLEKDYAIDLTINGSSSGIPFQSRVGFVADVGAQHALANAMSFALSLRVTRLSYTVQDTAVAANSIGVTASIHYSP